MPKESPHESCSLIRLALLTNHFRLRERARQETIFSDLSFIDIIPRPGLHKRVLFKQEQGYHPEFTRHTEIRDL
jgi:hypothetical protein